MQTQSKVGAQGVDSTAAAKGRRRALVEARDPRDLNKMRKRVCVPRGPPQFIVPFGVTYEKIGTIQRRLAWPLHKDDTLSRSGRPTGLNIYSFSSL